MRLDLRLFGGNGSSSGSKGAEKAQKKTGNKYKEDKKFWRKEAAEDTEAGLFQLFRRLESAAGGEVGDEAVSARFATDHPLAKMLARELESGGTENFKVEKVGNAYVVTANRQGLLSFSARMKTMVQRGRRWW